MHVIGLTGGIGSGKTTVAGLFAGYGVPIIDADQIARTLVEPGQPALQRIVQTFGEEILNGSGTLDRKKLRDLIFHDSKQRKQLEAILHPLIRENMMDQLDSVTAPYAILVIPLLVDTGNWEMMDRILVVDSEEDLQIERVMQRDNVDLEHAEAIIDNQVSRQERLAAADDVIENIGSIEDLKTQVKRLHEFYLSLEQQENYHRASQPRKNHFNSTPGRHWYEQPLNERIRTFLRLEHLFERATYHTESSSEHDAHAFIHTLIEINNLITRGDLKSEVIKELERQSQSLKKHSNDPAIDQERLNILLREQEKRMSELVNSKDQLGQHLKGDILFNNIRQRLNMPGGTCEFDLPIYSYWLNLPAAQRLSVMQAWLTPLQSPANAISLCLETIRGAAGPEPKIAFNGYYEQTLNGAQAQLIRVAIDQTQSYYPTISAGKHRFSIRFLEYMPGELSSPQVQHDVTFGLTVCNI